MSSVLSPPGRLESGNVFARLLLPTEMEGVVWDAAVVPGQATRRPVLENYSASTSQTGVMHTLSYYDGLGLVGNSEAKAGNMQLC